MLYLNDNIDALDVEAALDAVSPQRRDEALRYRQPGDRRQSLAVYLLLREALQKEYGIAGLPEFSFGPHGKPFLRDRPDIHFSLSHCRRAALCAVAGTPVGCDIEAVPDTLDIELCRHCFSTAETDTILSSPSPTIAFTTLWTKKEALLKMTGQGLTDHLHDLLLSPIAAKAHFDTRIATDNSYVYTVCTMKQH